MTKKHIIIAVSLFITNMLQGKNVDLIIFSYNRPLQLYAVLEGVQKYFSNLHNTYVLCRADQEYEKAYQEIQNSFPCVQFLKQGKNPRNDFKPLFLQCFFGSSSEYILLSVDDIIVKDYVDFNICIDALETSNAYGFYLRLGTNITRQYGQNLSLSIPPHEKAQKDIYKFKFKDGKGDWAYPHTVDMTLLKKTDVESFFKKSVYSSPNTLEAHWAQTANLDDYGLCFHTSKTFTLPLNMVQQDWYCSHENSFNTNDLLAKWKSRLKIDNDQFEKIDNDCCFMGYIPTFITRSQDL